MDKALLDFEVSIDADCKLLTVGKPFAIEGTKSDPYRRLPAGSLENTLSSPLNVSARTSGATSVKTTALKRNPTLQRAASCSHRTNSYAFFLFSHLIYFLEAPTCFYMDSFSAEANEAMVSKY